MRLLMIVLTFVYCSVSKAEEPRSIEVSAKSEIQVAPDEVVLYLAAHTRDKHLSIAKRDNDQITTAVMKLMSRYSIPDEDVQVSDLRIEPDYGQYDNRSVKPTAFEFIRSIRVRMTDFNNLEPFLSDAIDAGLNDIRRLHFRVSNQRKHQFEARKLAMTYAREKAEHLTELSDMQLGAPLRIEEGIESNWDAGGFGGMACASLTKPHPEQKRLGPGKPKLMPKLMLVNFQKEENEKTVRILSSPGQITISAEVTVEFEMKPQRAE